jgi:hypothetical protein
MREIQIPQIKGFIEYRKNWNEGVHRCALAGLKKLKILIRKKNKFGKISEMIQILFCIIFKRS